MADDVKVLCRFRDQCLLENGLGRRFVRFYYRTSPPIATYIRERGWLRASVRVGLRPAIWVSKVVLNEGYARVQALGLATLAVFALVAWSRRRRNRRLNRAVVPTREN